MSSILWDLCLSFELVESEMDELNEDLEKKSSSWMIWVVPGAVKLVLP